MKRPAFLCFSSAFLALFEVSVAHAQNTSSSVEMPPRVIPGTLEFENFDNGAGGVAFKDNTSGNSGGKYRNTQVDIQRSDDPLGGGYHVYTIRKGEWLRYTIQVAQEGDYRVELRLRPDSGRLRNALRIVFDGNLGKTLGPVTLPAKTAQPWITLAVNGSVRLTPGQHTLKIFFDRSLESAALNHFTITRVLPQVSIPGTVFSVTGLVAGEVNDATAINNAWRIQQTIESLPEQGGIVQLPAGIFYLRQDNPDEGDRDGVPGIQACETITPQCPDNPSVGAASNLAIYLRRGKFHLRGAGAGKTILKAKNRATTLLQVGNRFESDGLGVGIQNIILEGITFQANPFIAIAGNFDPVGLTGNRKAWDLGALISLFGNSPQGNEWVQNVIVRKCAFLDLHTLALNLANVRNARFANNAFVFFSSGPTPGYQALGFDNPKVGIFSGALRVENIEIVGNTFTGNGRMNGPADGAADGFVWLSHGGNWLVADNGIENYRFEGLQLVAGPYSIARNRFVTPSDNQSSTAVMTNHADALGPNLSSSQSLHSTFYIVGNTIQGGQVGVHAQHLDPRHLAWNAAFNLFVTSNTFHLLAESSQTTEPTAALLVGYAHEVLIAGNNIARSGRGLHWATFRDKAVPVAGKLSLRCNDFSRVSWQAFSPQEHALKALEQVDLLANVLGRGNDGFAHLHFDNDYPYSPADGILTRVVGLGNHFVNQQSGQLETNPFIIIYEPNKDAVNTAITPSESAFNLF